MKFTSQIIINKPRQEVIEIFDNSENMKEWMPGLQSFENLSGTPGQVGAKSKLVYKMGSREIEMIETVTVRNLPDEFSGTYEAQDVFNIVINKFIAISETQTQYITENEFQFKGFMKIIAFLMPKNFKKQSDKFMVDFKAFAEK